MVRKLYLQIGDNTYSHGECFLEKREKTVVNKNTKRLNKNVKQKEIYLDSTFLHYFMKEIYNSEYYRSCLVKYWTTNGIGALILTMRSTKYDLIDYKWNNCIYYMVRERCELEHALSWLSTLGGAFSALGKV